MRFPASSQKNSLKPAQDRIYIYLSIYKFLNLSFYLEWENAEAMYGYDPLIANAVATIQHLNCEIEEYPASK